MTIDEMHRIASLIRQDVIALSHKAGTPHLGSSLSCIDILTALYWSVMRVNPSEPNQNERDRFILSKGHAALALYVTLAERGFFSKEVLNTYNCDGGRLAEHPGPGCVPGVEAATGSLGHGLPLGIGMALAARFKRSPSRIFVLLGDGECNEGSVWEAAMMAPIHNLSHLAIIVDYNKWQATARSNETMCLAPLAAKWQAFGWETCEVDGHDIGQLVEVLHQVPTSSKKPLAIIAHTIKGRGVSFMEDDNNWHYRIPSAEEVCQAVRELQIA